MLIQAIYFECCSYSFLLPCRNIVALSLLLWLLTAIYYICLSACHIEIQHALYSILPVYICVSLAILTCSNFLNPARIFRFLIIIWKQEFEDFNCVMAFQTSSPTYLPSSHLLYHSRCNPSQSFCKLDNQISSIHALCSVVFLRKQDGGGDRIQLALFNRLVALLGGRTTLNLFSICHYSMLKVALLYVYPAINKTTHCDFAVLLTHDPLVG